MTSLRDHKAHHHCTNSSTKAFWCIATNNVNMTQMTEVNFGSTERENGSEAIQVGNIQTPLHFSVDCIYL